MAARKNAAAAAAATVSASTAATVKQNTVSAPAEKAPTPVAGKPLSQLEQIRARKAALDAGAAANRADAAAAEAPNLAEDAKINPPEREAIKANKPAARDGVDPVWDEAAVAWVFPAKVAHETRIASEVEHAAAAAVADPQTFNIPYAVLGEAFIEMVVEKIASRVVEKLQQK